MWPPLLAALVVLAAASPALADDAQALELAKNPFDAGNYKDAHERLSALLDPANPRCDAGPSPTGRCSLASPDLIEQARALEAASLVALGRGKDADDLIATILRANPTYQPSTAMFPPEVIDRFTVVRHKLQAELQSIQEQRERDLAQKRLAAQQAHDKEEAWVAELQRLAAQRVERNSRWIALIPFGIGQIQNGDTRAGIAFALSQAAFGGTSLVCVGIVNSLASTTVSTRTPTNQPVDIPTLNSRISTWVLVNRLTFAGWAALTAAGILHAEITFVPERSYNDRPVPPGRSWSRSPRPSRAARCWGWAARSESVRAGNALQPRVGSACWRARFQRVVPNAWFCPSAPRQKAKRGGRSVAPTPLATLAGTRSARPVAADEDPEARAGLVVRGNPVPADPALHVVPVDPDPGRAVPAPVTLDPEELGGGRDRDHLDLLGRRGNLHLNRGGRALLLDDRRHGRLRRRHDDLGLRRDRRPGLHLDRAAAATDHEGRRDARDSGNCELHQIHWLFLQGAVG